jgi:hypothetical protein
MPRWVRLVLPAALAATLSIKLLAAAWGASRQNEDPRLLLEASLRAAGFRTEAPLPDSQPALLPATRRSCSLLIAQISPLGWHRDLLERLTRPGETRHFAFRGEVGESQQVLETSLSFYRMRILRYAGLSAAEEPVWGIIASPECVAADIRDAFAPSAARTVPAGDTAPPEAKRVSR